MRFRWLLPFLPLLTACIHAPLSAGGEPRFAAVSNRQAALETCGCSLSPAGGVDREWNILEQLRAEGGPLVPLTIGTTFVPPPQTYRAANKSLYLKRAGLMADALKALGTRALGVSADDLALGLGEMRELSRRSGAPFVSANLYDRAGRRLFPASLALDFGGKRILITSVSADARAPYGVSRDFVARDPAASVQKLLVEEKNVSLVIVLSSAAPSVRDAAAGWSKLPTFWIGNADSKDSPDTTQSSPVFVSFAPLGLGRSVALLKSSTSGAPYSVRYFILDDRFESPVNSMTELIKRYRRELPELVKEDAGE